MRNNRRLKYEHYPWHDRVQQYWFNFHNFFFQSLVFRGRKIFAFNFFLKVKELLKHREHFDVFFIVLAAFTRITPCIVLLALKRGGRIHWMPSFITEIKKLIYTVKWVVKLLKDEKRIVTVTSVVDLLVSAIYFGGPAFVHKRAFYNSSLESRHFLKFFK
jgi:hypothetical protein